MKGRKKGEINEKTHKLILSFIILTMGMVDIAPVWGVTKDYLETEKETPEVELVEEIKDEDEIAEDEITEETKGESLEELEDEGLELTNTISGKTEESGISLMSFSVQNVGSYTPRTKQITGHNSTEYDDGEFRGTLERYVMRGSPANTKTVTGQTSANYNSGGYTGTLTRYLESGLPSDTKSVTGQSSSSYNKDGYVGTLTRYVASGSPADTKYVTNQSSSSYNSGGYTGTLTQYVSSGSASQSKYVEGQTSANYSDSSGYTGTLTRYRYSGSYTSSDTKFVTGQTSRNYNSGGYTGTLSEYLAGGSPSSSKYVTGQTSSSYNSGGYSGTLSSYTTTITPAHSKTATYTHVTTDRRYFTKRNGVWVRDWVDEGTRAPSSYNYNSGGYRGTLSRVTGGTTVTIDDGAPTSSTPGTSFVSVKQWHARYSGTVTKPAVTATRYRGTVYTADTRYYRYEGNVTRPASDTRVYRYRGTVYTPDTRVYRYQGDVSKPDTRQYAYEGNVTRPDTRVYKYEGNVSKPDTRVYGYRGTVYEIDKDAPEITIVTDGNSDPKTSQSTVVNVVDDYSGVEISQYQWTTSPEFPTGGTWTPFTSGDTISKDSGTDEYYLHIVAVDNEGNISQATSKAFNVENTPPKVPTLTINTTSYTNKEVVVTINYGNELNKLEYKVNEGEWKEYTSPIVIEDNGTVYAREISSSGLTSGVGSIKVSNIDKIAPEVKIFPENSEWINVDRVVAIRSTDIGSGIEKEEYAWTNSVGTPEEFIEYEEDLLLGKDGVWYFHYRVTDKAGNITEGYQGEYKIDKTKPTMEIEKSEEEWTNKGVIVTVTGKDEHSGVNYVELNQEYKDVNIVAMDDVMNYMSEDVVKGNNSVKFTVNDTYSGIGIPYTEITPGNNYVLSYDIRSLEGTLETFRGHLNLSEESEMYINGERVYEYLKNPYQASGVGIDVEEDDGGFYNVVVKFDTKRLEDGTSTDNNIYIQPNRSSETDVRVEVKNIQLVEGTEVIPYTQNSRDLKTKNNPLTLNFMENGDYEFIAMDNAGNSYTEVVTINNIDREKPEVTVTGNPTDYTEEDEITLTINAKDKKSGVKSIILPDNQKVQGETATYAVINNGKYTFTVEDKAGNKEEITVEVDKMTVPYFFYVRDSKGEGVEGAGFELYRDGDLYGYEESDVTGLVDFGRVPEQGKYTIKQIKAPEGQLIAPEEKEIDIEEEAPEVISHPRGTEMPSTGTLGSLVTVVLLVMATTLITYINTKKSKYRVNKK